MIGQVVGPFRGYFIASYACELGEQGNQYLGYAKLCESRPEDYFEAQEAVTKLCGDRSFASAQDAIANVVETARMLIANSVPSE